MFMPDKRPGISRAMKSLWYLPLTFLAGVHGFDMFAPYAAIFLALVHLLNRRRRKLVPVPIRVATTVPISSSQSTL